MSLPIKINDQALYEIMLTEERISYWEVILRKARAMWSQTDIDHVSIGERLYPTQVSVTSETYSRDADRTADYELEELTLVNRKAKIELEWDALDYDHATRLMSFLNYGYDFKVDGVIVPIAAPTFTVTYYDFIGQRIMNTYLGQTITGTLEEYEGSKYWRNFRLAFPER